MKMFGRILLLVVAGLLVYRGIAQFVSDYNAITTYPGGFPKLFEDFINSDDAKTLVISFIKDIFWLLVAVTALLAFLFSYSGFWMTIFTLVSLVLIGLDIYNKVKTGAFTKNMGEAVLAVVSDFGIQIAYVCGVILLKIGKKREESKEIA